MGRVPQNCYHVQQRDSQNAGESRALSAWRHLQFQASREQESQTTIATLRRELIYQKAETKIANQRVAAWLSSSRDQALGRQVLQGWWELTQTRRMADLCDSAAKRARAGMANEALSMKFKILNLKF